MNIKKKFIIIGLALVTQNSSFCSDGGCPPSGSPPCPPLGSTAGCLPRAGCVCTAHDSLVGETPCNPIPVFENPVQRTISCYARPLGGGEPELVHSVVTVFDLYRIKQSYKSGTCWYDDDTQNCKSCPDKSSTIWKSVNYGAKEYIGKCLSPSYCVNTGGVA